MSDSDFDSDSDSDPGPPARLQRQPAIPIVTERGFNS